MPSLFARCAFALLLCGMPARSQPAGEGISRELARERAHVVSNLHYRYSVVLEKRQNMIGHAAVRFDLLNAGPQSLALDFRDGTVANLLINGSKATAKIENGHINLPGDRLRSGQNQVELDFTAGVAEANRAITRFIDTEDGSEYQYSLFVPMDAHQAFPCFDQPDLKGRFRLEVKAPEDWTVVANAPAVSDTGGQHVFEETRPISTYLFAFAAGPFKQLPGTQQGLPMRLFVRKSMLARAKEEWPEVEKRVRDANSLMSTFFAQPFPFPKYDEVLIPGFPYGGMEHAGATFLNEEGVLFRTVPTVNDYNRRSTLLLHELAHQWFGDLVTMRWFDDLWLKEGFAQYMAYHTLAELEPPALVWKRFYESIKPNAYMIDGTRGTTPIYQQIRNLKDAKSAYGAIVYSKAPSILRVLTFRIGESAFRDGIRSFLADHAYSNAEWSDLIGAFSKASGIDLLPWANAWVQQRGMPQIEFEWACDGSNRIQRFEITQKNVLGENHLWPVEMQVLFGYRNDPAARIPATLTGARMSLPSVIGKGCPDYVFGNDEDHGYGRFLLDPKSQAEVIAELPKITDPFLRSLLWGALWDGMRESRLSPSEYLDLAMRALPAERDPEIATSLLGRMRTTYTAYLSEDRQRAVALAFESLLLNEMQKAITPDLRIGAFRCISAIATSEQGRQALKDMLSGKLNIPGVQFRQRDRWNILATLVSQADPEAERLLAAEREGDKTEDGRKYAYVAEAGRPTPENKNRFFEEYLTKEKIREDWISASLPQFNEWNQSALTAGYLKSALAALPQMKRERKIFFVLGWLSSFVGGQRTEEALHTVDAFLAKKDLDPDLRLKTLEVRDELARTVRIRALK